MPNFPSPALPSPASSSKSAKQVPLLSLAPPAVALGDVLGQNLISGDIWNVITRAADLLKDGDRLENLAWRHWSLPRARRSSFSSVGTGSSASLLTPTFEASFFRFERRTFGGALRLLLEDDNFRDWVGDAKRDLPVPTVSIPDTPVANVEIRLVEPTPVPSRVGSVGGSLSAGGLMAAAAIPPNLEEVEEILEPVKTRSPKPKNKFFLHSSPTKGESPPKALAKVNPRRRSSGSSSGGAAIRPKERRHVSLSTMRGKYQAEKRKAAERLNAEDEGSGWEDEDDGEEEDWSDEPSLKVKSKRRPRSRTSNPSKTDLAGRKYQSTPPNLPPPPAPTPLRKMSKKERIAAQAERQKIEALLEARRKREMFAKQQIFGSAGDGLLAGIFKRGGSMVDLTKAPELKIHPSPTHDHLSSLARSPIGPNLIRSKSAVAMPVQTGVSVTSEKPTRTSLGNTSEKPTRGPRGQTLESSDEDSDDDYLANSQTQRKLDELIAKKAQPQHPQTPQSSHPVDAPLQPSSPTTRRRQIIMREMSESLRKNLILERQKSSSSQNSVVSRPPPSTHTSQLPARASAISLINVGAALERQSSQQGPLLARRSGGVLGGGFLKPLTRVGGVGDTSISRTQSSANLTQVSPTNTVPSEAPMMQRRLTDGDGRLSDSTRRAELRRSETRDTSYRSHGW